MESIRELLWERPEPTMLSPAGDVTRPDCLLFLGAGAYERLYRGFLHRRSPGSVRRSGLLDRFLFRSSLSKIEVDATKRFDISVVLYPMGMDLAAWGIVVDKVGRVFELNSVQGEVVEFSYQGGCCRSRKDWRLLVGTRSPDSEQQVRIFYNRARSLASERVTVAGTVGFGFWDALWMSFDLDRAVGVLEHDPDFAEAVFRYWSEFHVASVRAMLDAGVKIILFREHGGGFLLGQDLAGRVDPFVREHLNELSSTIRSRGGCFILDCDADEMLSTDFPVKWGFDGIGPLSFRDREELSDAAAGLQEELFVVGAVPTPLVRDRCAEGLRKGARIILAQSPWDHRKVTGDLNEVSNKDDLNFASADVCLSS
ncbi:MAG: hypothetical protein FJY85_07800 [Deltaproteobacteria bacterium]|nr:hypothetical protein [Deltaproteobacteria bacterium]